MTKLDKNIYIGKTVIAGISYYDEHDKYLDQKQFHGKIVDVDPEQGICFVDGRTNEPHVLPPRADALFPAPKGSYREYTTEETICDPDFISLWHVKKVAGDNDRWEWQPYRADLRVQDTQRSGEARNEAEPQPAPDR